MSTYTLYQEGAVGKVLKECIENYTTTDNPKYDEQCNNLIDFVQETVSCICHHYTITI